MTTLNNAINELSNVYDITLPQTTINKLSTYTNHTFDIFLHPIHDNNIHLAVFPNTSDDCSSTDVLQFNTITKLEVPCD